MSSLLTTFKRQTLVMFHSCRFFLDICHFWPEALLQCFLEERKFSLNWVKPVHLVIHNIFVWPLSSSTFPFKVILFICISQNLHFYIHISVFKKYHLGKVSRYGKLKEMLADNFLNLMTVTSIILCSTMMTLMLMYHYRYKIIAHQWYG